MGRVTATCCVLAERHSGRGDDALKNVVLTVFRPDVLSWLSLTNDSGLGPTQDVMRYWLGIPT